MIDILLITKKNMFSPQNIANNINLRFIDSYKFFNISLEKLASYLDKDKLKITWSEFFNLSAEDFDLLTRKGIFQYTSTLTASNSYRKPSYYRVNCFTAH